MVKVVFIYPGISCGVGFNNFSSSGSTTETWPHPGMGLMSAVLKNAGYEVSLIDLRRLSGWDEFATRVTTLASGDDTVLFGLTVLTVNYGVVKQCVERLRTLAPQSPIVAGGPHATLMTDEVLADKLFDYIIKAEGELSILELVRGLDSDNPPEKGVINGKPAENLDDLPFFDRDLFSFEEQPVIDLLPRPFMTMVAGRGCLYHCTFCQPAERLMFGSVRNRSAQNVILELQQLIQSHGLKSTMFQDDCLTQERDWIFEFCDALDENNIDLKWSCQARSDIICANEDMIKRMSESGCIALSIGFESGSDKVLKFLGKHTTREQNLQAAKICHRYNINIIANYMFGIPNETEEDVWSTVSMMQEIRPYVYLCSFFTPTPGTGLYTYCERKGLLLDRPWEEYSRYPDSEKIKGIDYDLMKRALAESQRVGDVLDQNQICNQFESMGITPQKILLLRSVRNDQFLNTIEDFNTVYPSMQVDILVQDDVLDAFPDTCTRGTVYSVKNKFLHVDDISDELYRTLQNNEYDAVFVTCRKTYHSGYEQPQRIADKIVSNAKNKRFYFNEYREIAPDFIHAQLGIACE